MGGDIQKGQKKEVIERKHSRKEVLQVLTIHKDLFFFCFFYIIVINVVSLDTDYTASNKVIFFLKIILQQNTFNIDEWKIFLCFLRKHELAKQLRR